MYDAFERLRQEEVFSARDLEQARFLDVCIDERRLLIESGVLAHALIALERRGEGWRVPRSDLITKAIVFRDLGIPHTVVRGVGVRIEARFLLDGTVQTIPSEVMVYERIGDSHLVTDDFTNEHGLDVYNIDAMVESQKTSGVLPNLNPTFLHIGAGPGVSLWG